MLRISGRFRRPASVALRTPGRRSGPAGGVGDQRSQPVAVDVGEPQLRTGVTGVRPTITRMLGGPCAQVVVTSPPIKVDGFAATLVSGPPDT